MAASSRLRLRHRRARLLIVGCGDVGLRVAKVLQRRWRVLALTSSPDKRGSLRSAGVVPLMGNLDDASSLARLSGLADRVLHLAPPPSTGATDPRTQHLLAALGRGAAGLRLIYGSTTGVYGDAQGARFDETRAVAPTTDRARRRVDAEDAVRRFGRRHGAIVTVLRIPGIYALDREGGDPRERVRRAAPVLAPEDDVYTNHIHADDLARACIAALLRGRPQRVVHVSDNSELKMGDHFDLVARLSGLPSPPRLSRVEAQATLSPITMSFLSESRRLVNTRLTQELKLQLRYPGVADALANPLARASAPVPPSPTLRPPA